MFDFNDARLLDQMAYDAKLSDYPRGLNRARINDLANGKAPYSDEEVQENGVNVNVNSLDLTRLAHDGRAQFLQGFVKPGRYFSATTDYGPKHKRVGWSNIVSREINKLLKNSVSYYETIRSQFALLVLHGISPSVWENSDRMLPRVIGIEDALLPSGTLLGFDNLPWLILYRSFTAMELQKLVNGPVRDPGWKMKLVNGVLEWVDKESSQLMHSNWPEIWAPEKQTERIKSNSGFYASDQVPTIDCFDIYAYQDDGKKSGWIRRIILDSWGQPAQSGTGYTMARRTGRGDIDTVGEGDFLYSSGKRTVASNLSEIATFQFADLSAVAPFRYHSVRSLGYLLYAICHLQNRLRCKFSESVFEALMMYFRVKSGDDAQRALKVELLNRGFLDESLTIVPASDRFQVNSQLVELGLRENSQQISGNASSFTPSTGMNDRTEKTKFQVMAEMNTTQGLVSAGLQQAYMYKGFEYQEIFRRACKKNSTDALARTFQANVIRQGVPPEMLVAEKWNTEPDRIMGGGNKTMELAIAEQLMQWRQLYDPSSQRIILREATSAITDDPARADTLVPEQPAISDSVHDAQLAAGTLMQGLPVAVKSGINQTEYIETMLTAMTQIVQQIQQSGGVGTPDKINGLVNMNKHVSEHIQILAQDQNEKQRVKQYGDALGKIMNMVKAFAQRLQEQMQKQQAQGNGQMDPKDKAKILATQAVAAQKTDNLKQSHAIKTAQRQVAFEKEQKRSDAQTVAEIERENLRTAQELHHTGLKTRAKAFSEGTEKE